jgi:hypothetical protein
VRAAERLCCGMSPEVADTVAKVVLHRGSEILRAAGAAFV